MKIKQHGPRMKELKQEGKTNREIAADVGLKYKQGKRSFSRERREQRKRGYPRSRKNDASKTNQALRKELASLRIAFIAYTLQINQRRLTSSILISTFLYF